MHHTSQPPNGNDPADLRRIPPRQTGLIGRVQAVLESARFQNAIIALIALNAVTLGLETSKTVMAAAGPLLVLIDNLFLTVFVPESNVPIQTGEMALDAHILISLAAYALLTLTLAVLLFVSYQYVGSEGNEPAGL